MITKEEIKQLTILFLPVVVGILFSCIIFIIDFNIQISLESIALTMMFSGLVELFWCVPASYYLLSEIEKRKR